MEDQEVGFIPLHWDLHLPQILPIFLIKIESSFCPKEEGWGNNRGDKSFLQILEAHLRNWLIANQNALQKELISYWRVILWFREAILDCPK